MKVKGFMVRMCVYTGYVHAPRLMCSVIQIPGYHIYSNSVAPTIHKIIEHITTLVIQKFLVTDLNILTIPSHDQIASDTTSSSSLMISVL